MSPRYLSLSTELYRKQRALHQANLARLNYWKTAQANPFLPHSQHSKWLAFEKAQTETANEVFAMAYRGTHQ